MGKDLSMHEVIEKIHAGMLCPKTLGKEMRQHCTEFFLLEGKPSILIAKFLQVTDRTIRRDMEEIRKKNALVPNKDFSNEFIGMVRQRMENEAMFLFRLSRDGSASTKDRILAVATATRVLQGLAGLLQSCGYLPEAAVSSSGLGGADSRMETETYAEEGKPSPGVIAAMENLFPIERTQIINNIQAMIVEEIKRETGALETLTPPKNPSA